MLFEWIWKRDKQRCTDCVYKGEQCRIWKKPYTNETTQTGFDKNLAAKQCCDFMPKKALQRYIETLKKNNNWQKRYSTLDAGYNKLFKDFCKLQQEIAQLRAQVAKTKKALIVANNYMPDIGHFCTCGQCKKCGANINYASYGYCLKCARNIIDTALSDTPADYHNPADVEALKKAREAIKAAWSDRSVNAAMDKASDALAAIDKAIGGKEDV